MAPRINVLVDAGIELGHGGRRHLRTPQGLGDVFHTTYRDAGQSAVMLAAARLRHIAGTKWGTRCYLDMSKLREMDLQTAAA